MATVAITKDQEMALQQHHEDMRHMPEEAKSILRRGYYEASWDDAKENWIITHVNTGQFIAKVKAL